MKNIILQRIKNENYAFRPYGTCSTAAGVQEKIVSIVCPDKTDNSIVFSLLEGATILVEFLNVNSTANATLNVNNTGAKPIFYNGVALTETWQSRELVEFFYDGTNWNVLNTLGLSGSSSDETNSEGVIDVYYNELRDMRDAGTLTPGQQYRITDFVTTTAQEYTQSAGHRFDIIVTADTNTSLNENARAAKNADYTDYFVFSKLDAWELKYCLDNDTSRFGWADQDNGKGVIYWMKDEYGNECPFDFKNIQFGLEEYDGREELGNSNHAKYFKSWCEESFGEVLQKVWYYTFSSPLDGDDYSNMIDASNPIYLDSDMAPYETQVRVFKNKIEDEANDDYVRLIGRNLFIRLENNIVDYNEIGPGSRYNIICGRYNTLYKSNNRNVIGVNSCSNIFYTACAANMVGRDCFCNSFHQSSGYPGMTFFDGNHLKAEASYNTFHQMCAGNRLGEGSQCNVFHNYAARNELGMGCWCNIYETYATLNRLGNYCDANKFEPYAVLNSIVTRDNQGQLILRDYCYGNIFTAQTTDALVLDTRTASTNSKVENVRVNGVVGPVYSDGAIKFPYAGTKYDRNILSLVDSSNAVIYPDNVEKVFARKSNGKVVLYCPADLIADQN